MMLLKVVINFLKQRAPVSPLPYGYIKAEADGRCFQGLFSFIKKLEDPSEKQLMPFLGCKPLKLKLQFPLGESKQNM